MSIWQNKPDRDCTTQNFRIYRTPVGREVELVCLSPQFLGVKLHYWKGRSTPCIGHACEPCGNGHRPRWKGYVQAYHPATRTIVIFEFTERGYQPFQEALNQHGHLRGLRLKACRLNKKPNGPIQIAFAELREESPHLPKQGDLAAMLERIWEIRQQSYTFEPRNHENKPPESPRTEPQQTEPVVRLNGQPPRH